MIPRIFLLPAAVFAVILMLASCTQAERDGYNTKPFNAPASWEYQPYGGAFQY